MLRVVLAIGLGVAEPEEEPAVPIDLQWSAPKDCPDRDAVLRMMQEVAGRELVLSAEAELAVDGRVEARSDRYVLRLVLRSRDSEEVRELEAPACDALATAGSLVVVTRLLSPAASMPIPPPPSEPAPAGPQAQTPVDGASEELVTPIVADRPSAPRRKRLPPRVAIAALGGVAFGFTPRVSGMLRGGAALLWPGARLELFTRHVFARDRGDPGLQARFTAAGALGCWSPRVRSVEFPVCGGIELAAVAGEGSGRALGSRERQGLFVGIPLEAGAIWSPIRWLALRLVVGSTIAVRRPGFHLVDGTERASIWRPWPVSPYAVAGLEVRFP